MANQALFTPNRALDANAYALPGATATFYVTGTTTLKNVYSDEDGTILTTNPIVADGNGIFPQAFFNGEAKVVVKDADGATLWTVDPCPATSGTSTGAANVSFSPTVDLPETNVQDAIEAAAALAISGAADFGLGITGNAPTIGDIDATAQASGVYRFTAASTGTFPSGVLAATTGLVSLDRQTGAEAVMCLRAAGGSRYYLRHLSASTWGTWQEVPLAAAGAGRGSVPVKGASDWSGLALGVAGQSLVSDGTDAKWGAEGLMFALNSAHAGANATGAQDVFPLDVTLEGSTFYEFEVVLSLSKTVGTTNHSISFGYGGTATVNNILRYLDTSAVATATVAATLLSHGYYTAVTRFNMTGATGGAADLNFWIRERGIVSINAGGTFIPQYALSAAPGGAYSTNIGSFFRLRKLGASGANIAIGPWA